MHNSVTFTHQQLKHINEILIRVLATKYAQSSIQTQCNTQTHYFKQDAKPQNRVSG